MPKFRNVPSLVQDPLHQPLLEKSRAKRQNSKALFEREAAAPLLRNDPAPDLSFERVPIDRVTPSKRQVRALSDADVQDVVNSINAYGFCNPIPIDEQGAIIDGASRYGAAVKLGMTEVPCVRAVHLTPMQKKAAAIAFNRIGAKRCWDIAALREELLDIQAAGEPFAPIGFTSIEYD